MMFIVSEYIPAKCLIGCVGMDDVTELEKFRVPNTPPRVYYLPNFITHNEEIYLLGEIKKTPGW